MRTIVAPRNGGGPFAVRRAVAAMIGVAWSLHAAAQTASLTVPAPLGVSVREGSAPGHEGVKLFYRLVGDAVSPIVFLHGGPGLGIDDGGYDLEALALKGHSLLLLNERGAGRSEVITDPERLGLASYVRDLEAIRQQFHLSKMSVIGLSWGSAVAAAYAAEHPDRIDRIVFLSPMSLTRAFSDQRTQQLLSLLQPEEIAQLREAGSEAVWARTADADLPALCRASLEPVLRLYVTDPTHLARTKGNTCGYAPAALRNMNVVGAAGGASLGNWDFTPLLKKIDRPALVIEGAQSRVPLADARAWASALPDGRLLLIPTAGHMNWLDQPDAVIEVLDQFFRGEWPSLAAP